MRAPLCKITYTIPSPCSSSAAQTHTMQVHPEMSTYQIAQAIGNQIGCGYHCVIEEQVKGELMAILRSGNQGLGGVGGVGNCDFGDQEIWRDAMERVLGIGGVSPHGLDGRFKPKYFQTNSNYDAYLKSYSHKQLANKENHSGIYQRSLAKRKQTQEKLQKIKMEKQYQEQVQCTFTPDIRESAHFFKDKHPSFFREADGDRDRNRDEEIYRDGDRNRDHDDGKRHRTKEKDKDKQNAKVNTFEKLYRNAFDIKEKKTKRLRTIQNEEETRIAELSFIPVINQCSREICRMKSYASFVSEISDTQDNEKKDRSFACGKQQGKDNTVKKNKLQQYTFQPQISQNTKKLTKNLPGFYERLEQSNQKIKAKDKNNKNNKNNHKSSNNLFSMNKQKQTEKEKEKEKEKDKVRVSTNLSSRALVSKAQKQNRVNKIVLKKEIYTIDDGSVDQSHTDNLQTEKNNKVGKVLGDVGNLCGKDEELDFGTSTASIYEFLSAGSVTEEPKAKCVPNEGRNRSEQLFNNRKKTILDRIAKYFSCPTPTSIQQFSKNKKSHPQDENTEIQVWSIHKNPHIPKFVRELLTPITDELREAGLSLTQSEFVWALETLLEGLSLSDRGSLLGWGVKLLPQD